MYNKIALTTLCSVTNVTVWFLKWVRDKVVKLLRGGASVVSVAI